MIMAIVSLVIAGALIAVDQIIKMVVTNVLQPVGTVPVIPGLLDFTYVKNYGAAFGMMSGQTWIIVIVTGLLSALLIAALFFYKRHTWLSYAACILILAGGIGNLIDRVANPGNFVTDYIHVSFFPPVFNFADILVVVGAGLLVVYLIFFYGKKENPRKKAKG